METQSWVPQEVTGLDMAFGVGAEKRMPAYKDIPEEFKRGRGKWNDVVSTWFFRGLKDAKWTPKEGIDTAKALNHIRSIIGSFEPKHEHKEAACAYLLSLWFEDVTYKPAKKF